VCRRRQKKKLLNAHEKYGAAGRLGKQNGGVRIKQKLFTYQFQKKFLLTAAPVVPSLARHAESCG
jgi:hypothetical protein